MYCKIIFRNRDEVKRKGRRKGSGEMLVSIRKMLIRGMMNNLVYLAETEDCPMFRKTYRRCYRELANRLKEIKASERKKEYNL